MFSRNRLTRLVIIAAMIVAGLSFIALIVSNFDMEAQTLMAEAIAVLILLGVLIAAAAVAGFGLRVLRSRRGRRKEDDDEDD